MTFNQQNNQNKPVGVKNANLKGGETAVITGELVFSAITNGTTMFSQSSKFDKNAEHYGVIISNPTFETTSPELHAFLQSNVYDSKYNTKAITLNHSVQTGQIKVYDTVVRREEGIELERELGKQQVQVYIEIYYSTNFNTPALAVRAVLIEDENNINYLQNSSFLSAFGLEPNTNVSNVAKETVVETFDTPNNNGAFSPFGNNANQTKEVADSELPFNKTETQQTKGLDFGNVNNQRNNPFAR